MPFLVEISPNQESNYHTNLVATICDHALAGTDRQKL
jgi:hypothetical protein